jgi:peptide-methionine (S)-S-oxide reductase
MTILFYANDEQKKIALDSRDRVAERLGHPVTTEVVPLTAFYVAEDYHQKHELRHSALFGEFKKMYPNEADLLNSTAAARVNGFLGGFGKRETFQKEAESYGLSESARQALLADLKRRR